jgi:hypothetical protein
MNRLKARLSYANVAATVALFLAIGGGAYAAGTGGFGAGGSLRLCISRSGVVRAERQDKLCPRAQKAVAINERGPRGLAGQRGQPGSPGSPGQPGSPGAAVVTRIRSTGPLTTPTNSGSPTPVVMSVPVMGASWTQPAAASEWAFGTATLTASPTVCDGHGAAVNINGSTTNGIALQAAGNVAAGATVTLAIMDATSYQQIAFEPGTPTAQTATFKFAASCAGGDSGGQVTLNSLAVDIAQVS